MANPKYGKWIEEDGLTLITGWARRGLTEAQIANNMGISVTTLNQWKRNHEQILIALKKGKEVVDLEVENALFKRAMGYTYEENRIEILPDGTKKGVQVTRHVAPDVTAQIFWLKNRRPDLWRDKPVKETVHIESDDLLSKAFKQLEGEMNG